MTESTWQLQARALARARQLFDLRRYEQAEAGARSVLAQDPDKVIVCIALMQEDRLADPGREAELALEGLPLHDARRKIAVVVETAFADCHDLGCQREICKCRRTVVVEVPRMMRMNACGGKEKTVAGTSEFDSLSATSEACARDQHLHDSRRARARDHRITITVEAVVGEVDTDVDQLREGCDIVVQERPT